MTKKTKLNIAFAALLVATLAAAYFSLSGSDLMPLFTDLAILSKTVRQLGVWGPLLLIGLMALAIVFNPLPSAPIALAAGAVYGHTLGTVYIVAGAEIGALIAFMIARLAGYNLTRRFFGETGTLKGISSQNTLTLLVFASRLIPFMSFDLVSYASGLSPIKPWRFALATLLGLLPVSFALAHFGAQIGDGNARLLLGGVLLFGLLTIAPLLVRFFRPHNRNPRIDSSE